MADRGFLIENELKSRNASLEIPAFTKGKNQLHPTELEDTRKIARVRIHVERDIGLLKRKYTFLHGILCMSFISKESSQSDVLIIDQAVTVACALINLCRSVVTAK